MSRRASRPRPGRPYHLGLRIARLRDERGMSQEKLAGRVGVTRNYISMIESGDRVLDSRALLGDIADALGVRAEVLTALPKYARSAPEQAVHDAADLIRSALDGGESVEPVPAEQLQADVDEMAAARMACDYPRLLALLPTTLARCLDLTEAVGDPLSFRLFNRTLVTTSLTLRPFGMVDLGARLAERAEWAALRAERRSALGGARFARAQCALSGGRPGLRQRSLTLAATSAADLQGGADDGDRTWEIMLHQHAALAAATLGRTDDALSHIDEATELTRALSGDPEHMDAGTANAGVWRAAVLLECGLPEQALDVALGVDRSGLRTVQREAHLLTHTGHALHLLGRPEEAVRAFLTADRIAPGEVRGRARVHHVVSTMVRQARRRAGSDDLRKLANAVGIDPLEG